MKKLIMALSVFMLAGCSGGGETTTTVCTGNISGIEIETTFEANGDQVSTQVSINRTDLSALGVTEEDLQPTLDLMGETYEGIAGLSYDYKFEGETLVETITVDYNEADMDVLEENGIVDFGSQDAAIKYISLEDSIEAMEAMGMTCK